MRSAIWLLLVCGCAAAEPLGPVPFSVRDLDGDGYIDRQEFETFRAERQALRAREGRRLRNAQDAPAFDEIDADHDGRVSETELLNTLQRRRADRVPPSSVVR